MTPEQIKDKYESRILAVLQQMRQHLIRMGYPCDTPQKFSDDDYSWSLLVGDATTQKGADIRFVIAEEQDFDRDGNGVTFEIIITEFGGRILGQHCPYNYSNDVWVSRDDEDAIEERFQLFENPDLDMFSDHNGLHTRFTESCVERVLIADKPPALYGYEWIEGHCEMHQWASGGKDLHQDTLDHIDRLIKKSGEYTRGKHWHQIDITNLTALRDFLSSQLLQPQEA